jgi:dTDP-4-dehydrorhamnose 3,5-epimerase-like enzyme
MEIKPLRLHGCYEIRLVPRRDERGYFMRTFDREIFAQYGLSTEWLQENQSMSLRKWTLRGLHFQKPPHTETKLVRVLSGGSARCVRRSSKRQPNFRSVGGGGIICRGVQLCLHPKGICARLLLAHRECHRSLSRGLTLCAGSRGRHPLGR